MDPRRLLPALAAVAALCLVATVIVGLGRHWDPAGDVSAMDERTPSSPRPGPAAVLAAWDERRSAAWAAGDVAGLRDLYAVGSRTGGIDARLLRRYVDRGLRVTGLRTQVLSLRVLDRGAGRLRLLVTDRLVGGVAVGHGAPVPLPLPADRASTRRIDLVEVGEQWVVAEVRDQASAAASTSRTSSSSKS